MNIQLNDLKTKTKEAKYIADDDILLPLFLALRLEKPLLITGAAGVGKTEIAKVVSAIFDMELIRLQCYEGLDENKALYEWNYQKQLLHIQGKNVDSDDDIFSEPYLLSRPVLKALRSEKKCVLLIDEIDKTDAEFEAFLLEVLSDFQVSVPELGTVTAKERPIVILTSNGERDLSDAMKRRSVFLHIDYPSIDKEIAIIEAKVPELGPEITRQLARGAAYLRNDLSLRKDPSIAETLDWANSLLQLGADAFSEKLIEDTLNLLLKDQDDFDEFEAAGGSSKMLRAMLKSKEKDEDEEEMKKAEAQMKKHGR